MNFFKTLAPFFNVLPLCLAGLAPSARGAIASQWDFNGNLASSTGGSDLVPAAAAPATTPGFTFTDRAINGVQAQQITGLTVDGRWALGGTVLLFADEDQENAAGLVNSVQLRAEAMASEDLAALGGPSAAGIPQPAVPALSLLRPNGNEHFPAGSTQTVTWEAVNQIGRAHV